MKTELDHLPEHKQQEIKRAADIIHDTVKPDLIILFGSYARGDWVEELAPDQCHYQYQSDFDLLVVTKDEYLAAKIERKQSLRDRLQRELKTPISLIAEDIGFINRRLSECQYFYIDIKREGIVLYDSGKFTLAEPRELTPQERQRLAEDDFNYYFNKAVAFGKSFKLHLDEQDYNEAAFLLHQITERLYSAILLVFTHYKPNTHDLAALSKRIASFEPQFLTVFPQSTEAEKRHFELLRKAYVDSRYKKSYVITKEELEWLAKRVQYLQQLTETLCQEKMASFVPSSDPAP